MNKGLIKSSFDGKLQEIPGIMVDNFDSPFEDGAKAYFLSHFHTDHTVGLDKRPLLEKLRNEKTIFIYATKMTAEIIKYSYHHLKKYVRILNGSNLITIPGDPNYNRPELYINVRLIPAGHCLGSAMFLFETTTSKVLYTGDFRIRSNDLECYAGLHDECGNVIKLDALYVDTTFISKQYEDFPKRSDSVGEAISLIGQWLDSDDELCVVLDTPANYGYEYLFNQINKVLGQKVCVDETKWSFYSKIQHLVPGVTNTATVTRIFLRHVPKEVTFKRHKRIRFSAMKWDNWNGDNSTVNGDDAQIYVCFSTHCSRTELISFVEYLKPVRVQGFPKPYDPLDHSIRDERTSGANVEKFAPSPKTTPMKRPRDGDRYSPVKDRRVDGALLKKMFG